MSGFYEVTAASGVAAAGDRSEQRHQYGPAGYRVIPPPPAPSRGRRTPPPGVFSTRPTGSLRRHRAHHTHRRVRQAHPKLHSWLLQKVGRSPGLLCWSFTIVPSARFGSGYRQSRFARRSTRRLGEPRPLRAHDGVGSRLEIQPLCGVIERRWEISLMWSWSARVALDHPSRLYCPDRAFGWHWSSVPPSRETRCPRMSSKRLESTCSRV
jgi:hypothetical protein